ncbi:MAG: ATP-dependent RecD-like DNA helicase [Firmicutes bacterium ADurb.Bin300]|nr:MAG: ATP-dependent RecD-like DNA helicase [Firmicutes bacterium ADurb.Bin300]
MDETTLNGTVEDIVYRNATGSYTVISLETDEELITAVGALPDVSAGESITALGTFEYHKTYGRQFKVISYSRTLPSDTQQIYKYLSSGAISGIGPKRALRIIERFGDETLDIIENSPDKLSTIKGISINQAENIALNYRRQAALRAIILQLQKYDLTALECARIYKSLGSDCVNLIKKNPYCLCSLEIGIDFERAESIEALLETKPFESLRIEEGILHTLRHNLNAGGHTCIPRNKLVSRCAEYLKVSTECVESALEHLLETLRAVSCVFDDNEFIFLPSSFREEKAIARRIGVIMRFPPVRSNTLISDIETIERTEGIIFEQEQKKAIITAVNQGLLVLTGGPGTGKTTTLKGILSLFEKQGLDIQLAAPTGRAAQRMSEVTGRQAKTIHRLLEVQWDENEKPYFTRNSQNPLNCNAVVLDELSMVDISLFAAFLDALALGCRLVLVGDYDQLPPVGAGNVLRDIIDSEMLPVTQLKIVFRQALQSEIVTNAHRIIKGELPELENGKGTDFFHIERNTPLLCAKTIADLYEKRLPAAYGFDYRSDIQVICPSKIGESGTRHINALLQNRVNPKSEKKREYYIGSRVFREGDKVMQIRNNYMLQWEKSGEKGEGIFNGDIGVIKKILNSDGVFIIDFDGRITEYPLEYATELELSYAITVHKSQGSEFKAVIIAAVGLPYQLSYRNLLYTAVTRAKQLCITVGTSGEIARMVHNDKKTKRYSALKHFFALECENE